MKGKETPIEWLEETIRQMIYNGGDLGEDEPALMEHIKHAKEMETQRERTLVQTAYRDYHDLSHIYGLDVETYYKENYGK